MQNTKDRKSLATVPLNKKYDPIHFVTLNVYFGKQLVIPVRLSSVCSSTGVHFVIYETGTKYLKP